MATENFDADDLMRSLILGVENLERYVKKMIHQNKRTKFSKNEFNKNDESIKDDAISFKSLFNSFAESERMNLH